MFVVPSNSCIGLYPPTYSPFVLISLFRKAATVFMGPFSHAQPDKKQSLSKIVYRYIHVPSSIGSAQVQLLNGATSLSITHSEIKEHGLQA